MFKTTEVQITALPPDLQSFVTESIANNEKVVFCILVQNPKPQVIVLTDFKLLLSTRILTLSADRDPQIAWLDKIHAITMRGFRWPMDPYELYVDGLSLDFDSDILRQKFHGELKKAINNASVRMRTSAHITQSTIPDVADQLAKLFDLYKNKAITAVEYEAAKKKLLG